MFYYYHSNIIVMRMFHRCMHSCMMNEFMHVLSEAGQRRRCVETPASVCRLQAAHVWSQRSRGAPAYHSERASIRTSVSKRSGEQRRPSHTERSGHTHTHTHTKHQSYTPWAPQRTLTVLYSAGDFRSSSQQRSVQSRAAAGATGLWCELTTGDHTHIDRHTHTHTLTLSHTHTHSHTRIQTCLLTHRHTH